MQQENKSSTLVNWIGYLAITLLLVLPISVLTVRGNRASCSMRSPAWAACWFLPWRASCC